MENRTIKFYKNIKNGRYFISGKNDKDKWFFLNKNKDFNDGLYLDNDKFKGGCDVFCKDLKLLENDKNCNILVFKTAEAERGFCISKEEIEKREKARKEKKTITNDTYNFVGELFAELVKLNSDVLDFGEKINDLVAKFNKENEEQKTEIMEEIEDEDLPF